MAGGHLRLQQHRVRVGLAVPQCGNPFRGLDVEHPGVVQRCHRQDRRVVLGLDVLVRRVGLHVEVDVRVLEGVAPFVPFGDRQRQRRIQDRGQRVHERHLGEDAREQFRRQVGHRAHQQSPGAAAEGHQVLRPGSAGVDEVPGHRDEVGEGVLLLQQLAPLVPQPAHLAAAANVRDREHHPAVQQGQPRDGEPRVLRGLVGAVAVKHCRSREVDARPIDERDRDPGPVLGHRPVPVFHVVLAAVVAEHGLLAQQGAFPAAQVDVVDPQRRDERRGGDPQFRGVPVRVARQTRRGQLGVEVDLLRLAVTVAGGDRPELDARQRLPAVAHHQMVGEGVHTFESDVVAGGDQGPLLRRVGNRRFGQGEVHRSVVVQDQETVLAADDGVFDGVFDTVAAGQHRGEGRRGIGGVGVADLRGHRRTGRDDHVGVAPGAAHRDPVPFVGFVVDRLVGVGRTEPVPPHGVGAPRVVDGRVVHRGVVGRPGHPRCDPGDDVRIELTAA